MKRVYPYKEYCIGCKLCELACLTAHSEAKDLIIAYTKERVAGLTSSIRVVESNGVSVALNCRHCDEPACVTVCDAGALSKNNVTGIVEYDFEKCVGCWSCLVSCSYGAIQRNSLINKIVKCDLCSGRAEGPACVQACPNRALKFFENDSVSIDKFQADRKSKEVSENNRTDINNLDEFIHISKNTKRAVVLGGSVSGLKAAEKLFNLGLEVAIVESGERILALEFDKKTADLVVRRIEEAGILLKCGVSVNDIICDKAGLAKGVLLSDKSFLEAGVIVATKSFSSTGDLLCAQIAEVQNCVAVSDSEQILSVNDQSGISRNISMNSFVFYGMPLVAMGEINLSDDIQNYESHIFYDEIKHSYRKLVFKDSMLAGYILIGDIDYAGVYTSFIKFECELDTVTKNRLCDGFPDILMWPDELFFKEWNP